MESDKDIEKVSNIDKQKTDDVNNGDGTEANVTQTYDADCDDGLEANNTQTILPGQNNDDSSIKQPIDKKNKRGLSSQRLRDALAIISIVISLTAFLFTLFPSLKWFSDNYEEKALSGNVKAQMYLAEEAFNNSDYESAILWYKKAVGKKGKYQAYALNNLGWLYANGYGLNQLDANSEERMTMVASLFDKACDLGLDTAEKNCCLLLYCNENIRILNDTNIYDKYFESGEPKDKLYPVENRYSFFQVFKGETFRMGFSEYSYSRRTADSTGEIINYYYRYYCTMYGVSPNRSGFEFCYLFNDDISQ